MNKYYSIVIVFCLLACSSGNKTTDAFTVHVDFSNCKESLPLSSFIDSVHSIRLELPDSLFFGEVSDVLFADTNIYVTDSKQAVVYRFNSKGEFLNKIGKRGGGPGEYTSMNSCFLGKDVVFIDNLSARQIYSYTPDGNFIDRISFSFSLVYTDIMCLPNGDFLCHSLSPNSNDGPMNRGLWIMNSKGEKIKTILSITDVYPYVFSPFSSFLPGEDSLIYICEPPTGMTYSFNLNNHELKEVIHQRSDVKMLSEFKGMRDDFSIKEDHTYCYTLVTSNHYIFSLWPLLGETPMWVSTLYSKVTRETEVFKSPMYDIPGTFAMGNYVTSNVPNTLVSYFSDEPLREYFPEEYKRLKMKENILIVNKFVFK